MSYKIEIICQNYLLLAFLKETEPDDKLCDLPDLESLFDDFDDDDDDHTDGDHLVNQPKKAFSRSGK